MKVLRIFATLIVLCACLIVITIAIIGPNKAEQARSYFADRIVLAFDPNNKAPAAINNFAADGTLCRPVWVTLKPGQEETFEPQEACKNLMWEREDIAGTVTLNFDGSNGVQDGTWTNESAPPFYDGAYIKCMTLRNESPRPISVKFSYKN